MDSGAIRWWSLWPEYLKKLGTQKLLRVSQHESLDKAMSYEQIWRAENYWGFDSYSEHRVWSLGDIRTRHGYQGWGFRELSLREIPFINGSLKSMRDFPGKPCLNTGRHLHVGRRISDMYIYSVLLFFLFKIQWVKATRYCLKIMDPSYVIISKWFQFMSYFHCQYGFERFWQF